MEVLCQGVTPVIKPRLEASLAEEKACFSSQEFRDLEMNLEVGSEDCSDALEELASEK